MRQFSGKMDNFDFFCQNLPKNGFKFGNSEHYGRNFQACQFSGKTNNFDFFGTNLCKNGSRDRNFKNLNPDLESAPPGYYVGKFLVKTDNFEFFGLNLRKLTNCVGYFGSYNVEGVAESWVEAETRWSWVEVDGTG